MYDSCRLPSRCDEHVVSDQQPVPNSSPRKKGKKRIGREKKLKKEMSTTNILPIRGYINSFGIFQTYYATTLDLPPSTISWIGSIQVFLLFFIGAFTGRLTDAGYFRPILLLGSLFQLLGIFATSFATTYWQLFLAQGVCLGLGNGCLFCPAVSTVSTYFSTKRGLAIGISACGSATGGLIFPAMARQLLPTVGFGWTVRAIGFVQAFGLVVANWVLRTRVPPRKTGTLVDWAVFEELEYTFYAAGSFTVSFSRTATSTAWI